MAAVKGNHVSVVDALLRAGAKTDVTDEQGKTALGLAVQGEQHEVVRLLKRASEKAAT